MREITKLIREPKYLLKRRSSGQENTAKANKIAIAALLNKGEELL